MAISQKLHTKLVQKLILTPSLQQAIKLLPMSTLELAELLNEEMVENPLLEEVPTEELQPAEQQQAEKAEAEKPATEKTDQWDDADYEYFFGDYLDDGYRPRAAQEVRELPPIENTLSSTSSLADHLLWQLAMQTDDPVLRDQAISDLFWDRIVGIDADGDEDVFDLTVPGPSSWLADGIVSHNSGALEQDADVVMFIYREEEYKPTEENRGVAEIIIGKQRNGPTGMLKLAFIKEYTRFENFDWRNG